MVTLHISTVWPNLHACAQQGTRRMAARGLLPTALRRSCAFCYWFTQHKRHQQIRFAYLSSPRLVFFQRSTGIIFLNKTN